VTRIAARPTGSRFTFCEAGYHFYVTNPKERAMSGTDKLKNATESTVGEAKEKIGGATGDDDMKAEGKVDSTKADLKQAGEKVKDAFK
jgi:uncharacterized protein YjbJ (UPF0337 family)